MEDGTHAGSRLRSRAGTPARMMKGVQMKCQICREPARGVVIFRKEEKSKTGYLVLDNSVSFDREQISKFVYYCQSKGLSLKKKSIIDLCPDCLREAKINLN